MDKKLPGVFVNKIEKRMDNNKTVFYGSKEGSTSASQKSVFENTRKFEIPLNIRQKIKHIFESEHYIYKMDVVLTTKDKKIEKRVVGYNDHDLITFDNELIPISEIVDIEVK